MQYQLHVLIGLTWMDIPPHLGIGFNVPFGNDDGGPKATNRLISSSTVYDLRNYTSEKMYGPYIDAGERQVTKGNLRLPWDCSGSKESSESSSITDEKENRSNNTEIIQQELQRPRDDCVHTSIPNILTNWTHLFHIHRVFNLNFLERTVSNPSRLFIRTGLGIPKLIGS